MKMAQAYGKCIAYRLHYDGTLVDLSSSAQINRTASGLGVRRDEMILTIDPVKGRFGGIYRDVLIMGLYGLLKGCISGDRDLKRSAAEIRQVILQKDVKPHLPRRADLHSDAIASHRCVTILRQLHHVICELSRSPVK